MAIQTFTINMGTGTKLKIYAEPANLQYFVGNIEPDAAGGPFNKQVAAAGGTRRKYPGGPGVSYSGSNREILVDPGRKSGTALPGKPFVLREHGANEDLGQKNERRQFSYVGRVIDLHAWLRSNVDRPTFLHTSSGARYLLKDVESGGGAGA